MGIMGIRPKGDNHVEKYKNFFKMGTIYPVSLNYSPWMVSDSLSLKENVIPHFKEKRVFLFKQKDFYILKKCLDIVARKECCKKECIERVVECSYDLNMGGTCRK